jgi:solute carrier family 8 (sodium/calcium exchanger)
VKYFPRGRIVYYGSRTGVCDEPFILMPGIALLPKGLLFVAYGFSLIFLFLGIGIISDVFMNGIEEITAQTVTIDLKDANGDTYAQKKVHVWNSTVANLTLMALGSSAPEILLAVIETMGTMD